MVVGTRLPEATSGKPWYASQPNFKLAVDTYQVLSFSDLVTFGPRLWYKHSLLSGLHFWMGEHIIT
jgi:hypothetical protein